MTKYTELGAVPSGEMTMENNPVQSGLTEYVPVMESLTGFPLALANAVAIVLPFPSKLWMPTLANGPASGGGALKTTPVMVYPKVPARVAFEHALSSAALAEGALARPSAEVIVMAKALATIFRFISVAFAFSVDGFVLPLFDNERKTNPAEVLRGNVGVAHVVSTL
jgi:hypothetical protein